MEKTGFILEELKANTPILATIRQLDVYTVPTGYFEHLATVIRARISGEILFEIADSNVYQVPTGYFETLSNTVISRIETKENEIFAELEKIASSLNGIGKKNVYSIPSNYFENLTVTAYKKSTAKVISFSNTRKWVSYAAAVIIAGVLVSGSFFYNYHNSPSYIIKEIKKVSDEELNTYVKDHVVALNDEEVEMRGDAKNVQESLKLSSDEELEQYLNENTETYLEAPLKTD